LGVWGYYELMKIKKNKIKENPLKAQIREFAKNLEQYTIVTSETIKALEEYSGIKK